MLEDISMVPFAIFDLWHAFRVASLDTPWRTRLVVGHKKAERKQFLVSVLIMVLITGTLRSECGAHLNHPGMLDTWSSDIMDIMYLRATRTTCTEFQSDMENPIYANLGRK